MTKGAASQPYRGPVKRSVTIAGHPTSISLEPPFWTALERAARDEALPLSALVARIDAERLEGGGANLASAVRCWLLNRAEARARAAGGNAMVGPDA